VQFASYYGLSNRLCRATGQFCDPQFLNWTSQNGGLTQSQSCSKCWLGVLDFELGSPLGYDDTLASNFASLTSTCNATGYTWTSPTAYALNSTATTLPASSTTSHPPTCTGTYTVRNFPQSLSDFTLFGYACFTIGFMRECPYIILPSGTNLILIDSTRCKLMIHATPSPRHSMCPHSIYSIRTAWICTVKVFQMLSIKLYVFHSRVIHIPGKHRIHAILLSYH
jgi:hypothetical protein